MLSKSIEPDFSAWNWTAESEKIRYVYSREILLNTATIREVNSTEIDSSYFYGERFTGLRAITTPSYKQPNKLSQLQNTPLNLLTMTFLAILKWTEINLRWLIVNGWVKEGKSWRIPLAKFRQWEKNPARGLYRPWQTRTHFCGHINADTNVSPFARAGNICCGHKCFPVCAVQETSWATMCLQQCVLVWTGHVRMISQSNLRI